MKKPISHGLTRTSSLLVCLFFLHCATYAPGSGPEDPEPLPSLDYVRTTLAGTWLWQKPSGSPVTFDMYYDFGSDGACEVRQFLDDTAVIRTVYSVARERSRWSGRPICVIRIEDHVSWELLSISPESFSVRHGGADLTIIDTYVRVHL